MYEVNGRQVGHTNKGPKLLQLQPVIPVFKQIKTGIEEAFLRIECPSKKPCMNWNVVFQHEVHGTVIVDVIPENSFLTVSVQLDAARIRIGHHSFRMTFQAIDQVCNVLWQQPVVFVQKQGVWGFGFV